MGSYHEPFEWIDLPGGRARYVGVSRGRDEPLIDTFAIELQGNAYYGEIRRAYLPDRNHYDLQVRARSMCRKMKAQLTAYAYPKRKGWTE